MRKLRPGIKRIISWPVVPALSAASSIGINLAEKGESVLRYKLELAGFSERTATLGDAEVHYWIGGKGQPILLLHGIGPSGIWQWHEQVRALAARHRVILPDLLWYGRSFSREPDYSLDHQVQAVLSLLNHLGVDRAHLAAIPYGGFVAYELAALHPERVDKVILCDSPGRAYTRADYEAMCARLGIGSIAELMIPRSREALRKLIRIASYENPILPDCVLDDTLTHLFSAHCDEQVQLIEWLLVHGDEVRARPEAMRAPTLIIWGRHDQLFPLEIGRRLAESLGPSARLVVIEKAGHPPNLEHAKEVNRLILEFLDGSLK